MRKIRNGKAYDTETAREVGSHENMYDASDFHWYEETLYRKRTGEYFLHGRGNAMTRYAVSTGTSSWRGGEEITPLSYTEATDWAEEYLDAEAYEAEFGEVPEGDDDTVPVTLRLSAEAAQLLERAASKAGQTKAQTANDAIVAACREL